MPKSTLTERVTVLETQFEIITNGMRKDLKEVKEDVKTITLQMPELMRRVGEHHKVFHDHVAVINQLKKSTLGGNNGSNGYNGEKNRRRTDAKKYRYARWAVIISILGLIASNIATCSWVASNVAKILESMPQ